MYTHYFIIPLVIIAFIDFIDLSCIVSSMSLSIRLAKNRPYYTENDRLYIPFITVVFLFINLIYFIATGIAFVFSSV